MTTAEAIQHLTQLKASSNTAFWPLYFDEHRYLVLMGGGGSGKSIFAGRKVLERVTTENNHRWLVCRKVARTLRDSCFAQLRDQLSEFYPDAEAKVLVGDMRIELPKTNSEIIFAGLDDVEKLKSIFNITGIWIEEASEITEEDFNQLDIRLRTQFPHYLQMIFSFNPISVTHWLKRRFFDTTDPKVQTSRSTYKDNRFLTPEAVHTLEGFKDTDPYYYQVYCLGEWGVTGKTVFDGEAVSRRLGELPTPLKQGMFDYLPDPETGVYRSSWHPENDGPLTIYKDVDKTHPYVIGADTSGEGSDYFVAQVLDNITGEQVAVLRHQYDEDRFAEQLYCLGLYYNTALVAIEANFSTFPIKRLEQLGYPNQYVRETEDTYSGAMRSSFGFKTTAITRPIIIAGLVEAMRTGVRLINDRTTLEEMLTFVHAVKSDRRIRDEAEQGAHDDCIMSLAIAWYIRPKQRATATVAEPEGVREWEDDMWEDYYNGSAEDRAVMIARWGRPKRVIAS